MSARVTLEIAPICCATIDGRKLSLSGTVQAEMALSIAANYSSEETDGFPWAIVAANYEFSDSVGNRWRITSRFHSELFVRSMMDFSSSGSSFVWKRFAPDVKREFDDNIALRDVWFSSDDRSIRPLIVGRKIKDVQFKYFGVRFDVAVIPEAYTKDIHYPKVLARTSEMLSYHGETIPALCFAVDKKYFLLNQYSSDLKPSDIPVPLIAEPIQGVGEPQASVVVEK